MRKTAGSICVGLAMFSLLAVSWQDSESFCVIFPQNGRDIFGVAQRNILIIDQDQVSLIPQVHFEGDARDFGILVPTPSEPSLSTAGSNVFNEASFMTQPLTRRSTGSCGCEDGNDFDSMFFNRANFGPAALVDSDGDGVTIVYEQTVGMYQAVVLQATNVADLTAWLSENDYAYDQGDSDLLQDYVAQNWYFVAMKLDPAQVPGYIDQWWTATTSPAKITFAHSGNSLTYPLKISAISTNERSDVLIYTIAADPMRFPGADVEYANAFDTAELAAIAGSYPQLSTLIKPGSFVTKLRKTFTKDEMHSDIELVKSDDRREFRQIRYVNDRNGFGLASIGLLFLGFYLRRKR